MAVMRIRGLVAHWRQGRLPLALSAGAGAVAALLLAGCVGPFEGGDYRLVDLDPERLRAIETSDFREQSIEPPIPLEEAMKKELVEEWKERYVTAEETMELSLEDVRAAALENNLDLEVQLINPAIAAATVDEEEAKFESAFFGSANYTEIDSPTALGTEGTQTDVVNAEFGVNVPLATGGAFRASVPISETDTNNPFSLLNPSYDAGLQFSISQPLLRGAGVRANTHSIRVARGQAQITGAQTKLETIRILANADRAYWRLYAAQRELEVRIEEYRLAVRQLERAERQVNARTTPEIEVIRAQSGIAQRLEAIIIAYTNVKQRTRNLKRLMNQADLPIDSDVRFVLRSEPDPVALELDAQELQAFAVVNRMEMLELEIQLAIDASTIDFQRNAALPLFTIDYRYAHRGLGDSYNDAFDQIVDRSYSDWTVGAQVEIPIGNEAAEARVHRAILQRVQRLATRSQRSQAIREEVLNALDQLDQNWQRILAARQGAILAGRTLEAEQRQFDVGASTSTDVLDAATQLSNAQSAEIQALADYQISRIDLAFATGTLLGYGKVRWEPIDATPIDLE